MAQRAQYCSEGNGTDRRYLQRRRRGGLNKSQLCAQEKVNILSSNSWIQSLPIASKPCPGAEMALSSDKSFCRKAALGSPPMRFPQGAVFVSARKIQQSPNSLVAIKPVTQTNV